MDIFFSDQKLADIFNSQKKLVREYGLENARVIMRRMELLRASICLNDVSTYPPTRRHELTLNRRGQFAVDLKQPFRLVFQPCHNPLPKKPDGGLDLIKVTAITIIAVEDYH